MPRAAQIFLFRLGSPWLRAWTRSRLAVAPSAQRALRPPGHALRAAARDATIASPGTLRKLNLDAPTAKLECHRKLSAVALEIRNRLGNSVILPLRLTRKCKGVSFSVHMASASPRSRGANYFRGRNGNNVNASAFASSRNVRSSTVPILRISRQTLIDQRKQSAALPGFFASPA